MKKVFSLLTVLINLSTPGLAFAKNDCVCKVLPESKTYQGEARKKKLIGFTVDWSCDYRCRVDIRDQDPTSTVAVRAFYHDYFLGEDGDEGICEGVVYKMSYNSYAGKNVYSTTGEIRGIIPKHSSSADLRAWSEANDCE